MGLAAVVALAAGLGVGTLAAAWVEPSAPAPVGAPAPLPAGPQAGLKADPGQAFEAAEPTESTGRAAASPTPRGGGGEPSAATVGRTDWWAVFERLDRRRAEVLASGDPRRLADYAVPGSPAHRADAQLLEELATRGVRPEGLSSRILAIEEVTGTGARVRAQIVDLRSGYRLVDVVSGDVVERLARAGAKRWSVTLEALPGSGDVDSSPAEATRGSTQDERAPLHWRVVSARLSD